MISKKTPVNEHTSEQLDVSKSLLSYKEATALSLKTRWKLATCNSGEDCWCRLIVPEIEIEDKDGNEIYIAGMGCISKVHAEHIVNLHNKQIDSQTLTEINTQVSVNHALNRNFKKIPIIISKYNDGDIKGWRAELPDNYQDYKTSKYEQINFEDLSFHFHHNTETHDNDDLVFCRRKDAVECAKYINKKYLNNKAKIWFL